MLPETKTRHSGPHAPDLQRGRLIYLGMGSNRGDRLANVRRAMEELGKVGVKVQTRVFILQNRARRLRTTGMVPELRRGSNDDVDADATLEGCQIRGAGAGVGRPGVNKGPETD